MFSIRDIVVLAVIFGSIPVCFFRPTYGAALWVVMSFVNPQDLAGDLAQHSSPALLVAVPTLLGFFAFSRNWKQFAIQGSGSNGGVMALVYGDNIE